jgi:DNA-binding NtrC family response regulator
MYDSLPADYKPRVLLVDDDDLVLAVMHDQLRKRCRCTAVQDPREALTLLAQEEFDVLVSDQVMPHLSGDQLLARAYQNWPGTERILITGYADVNSILRAVNNGQISHYIAKPWNAAELLESVLQAAGRVVRRRMQAEAYQAACKERGQALQALEEGRSLVRELGLAPTRPGLKPKSGKLGG